MAILRLGQTVIGIRGTIAGVTYSQNRSGAYAKGWARGSNPRRPLQQNVRNQIAQMGQLWQSLTPAQIIAWDGFAALGPEPTYNSLGQLLDLSGFNYFTRCNVRRLQMGYPIELDPPAPPQHFAPPVLVPLTLTVHDPVSTHSTITWDPVSAQADAFAVIYLGVTVSAARAPLTKGLWFVHAEAAGNATADFQATISEKLGEIQVGWSATAQIVQRYSTGLESIVQSIQAVVT
jgi:hypothetical protein